MSLDMPAGFLAVGMLFFHAGAAPKMEWFVFYARGL